jgi:hypothetical protein
MLATGKLRKINTFTKFCMYSWRNEGFQACGLEPFNGLSFQEQKVGISQRQNS